MILYNVIRTLKFKFKPILSNSYIHENMIGIFEVEILLLFTTIRNRELYFVVTAVVEINFNMVSCLCFVEVHNNRKYKLIKYYA